MKRWLAATMTATVVACAVLGFGGVASASAAEPAGAAHGDVEAQALADALATIDERATPIEVRATALGVESDYEFGNGSILTVFEASSQEGVIAPLISAGRDDTGFFIELTPEDQRSFLAGGSTLILGAIGLLLGPGGALVLGALGAFLGPQLEGLACSSSDQSFRFYYTLDGNVQSAVCV